MNQAPHASPDLPDVQTAPDRFDGGSLLAAHVAARLCHDFISPSGAILSGLDLMRDPGAEDMREEALGLIETSARKLVSIVNFARVAFGAASSSEAFDAAELKRLLEGVFAHMRASLEWASDVDLFAKSEARVLLNLAHLGGAALPSGGRAVLAARRDEAGLTVAVESRGARARLKAEMLTGLKGETLSEGLPGEWIQSFWLHRAVSGLGGLLTVELGEELVLIRAALPRAC